MKRVLVLSDSHGNVNNMILAVRREMPEMIIHLGDCWADAEQLQKKCLGIPLEQVPGNCDCRQEFLERILLIEGKKILICHGHTYNVKAGYMNLQYGAQEKEVDAGSHCSHISIRALFVRISIFKFPCFFAKSAHADAYPVRESIARRSAS